MKIRYGRNVYKKEAFSSRTLAWFDDYVRANPAKNKWSLSDFPKPLQTLMLRDVENAEFRQKVEEGRKEVREALGIFDEEEPTYTEAQAKAVLGSFKGRSTSATPQLPRGPGKLA